MPRYIPIDLPKPEDQTKKYEQQPPGLIQKEPTATSASRKSMFSTRPPGSHRRRPSQDRWETQIVKYGWLVTSKYIYILVKMINSNYHILTYSYHYFLGGVDTWNQLFGYFATRTLNWRSGKLLTRPLVRAGHQGSSLSMSQPGWEGPIGCRSLGDFSSFIYPSWL